MVPEESAGPVIVYMEGEELPISKEEFQLLELGPDFCVINGCSEEEAKSDIETAIVKEKWDRLSRDEKNHTLTEEKLENDKVAKLAEEVAAQARQAYDNDTKIWTGTGLRVTDYKADTRQSLKNIQSFLGTEFQLKTFLTQIISIST